MTIILLQRCCSSVNHYGITHLVIQLCLGFDSEDSRCGARSRATQITSSDKFAFGDFRLHETLEIGGI